MRNSERVLNSLAIHSRQPNYKFERLYRLLFNEQMYYAAYQRIYAKEGNMTKGADNATIDHMSISRIEKLIISLKDESYQPIPSRRVYIPKKNGKKRPLGISTFNDKLLQEVVRMIWKRYMKVALTTIPMVLDPSEVVIQPCNKFKSHSMGHVGS